MCHSANALLMCEFWKANELDFDNRDSILDPKVR